MIIGLLTSVVNASNQTKCVSLNNQQCMIPALKITTGQWSLTVATGFVTA